MESFFWKIDDDNVRALTAALRARLLSEHGHTAAPEHTHVALVDVMREGRGGVTCVLSFPITVRAADWSGATGTLEGTIDAECRARLLAIRNGEPLTSIVGRRHPL